MVQQTAVNWVISVVDNLIPSADLESVRKLLEQAKKMEKDQICEAWQHGKQQTFLGLGKVLTSEEYYNETYNK